MLRKIGRVVSAVLLILLGAGGLQGLWNNLGTAQSLFQHSISVGQLVLGIAGLAAGIGALSRKRWAGSAALVFALGMGYAAGAGPEGLSGSRQAGPRVAAAAERALEELRETLRIDPGCGLAVYYTGVIQGEIGRFEEAEKNLRRSIKVLMPDRRPIQALKDLQAKQKKRKRLGLF